MLYEGKLYSGDKYIGTIHGESTKSLKAVASQKCNGYFNVCDRLEVSIVGSNRLENPVVFSRINRICPNNTIARGRWR